MRRTACVALVAAAALAAAGCSSLRTYADWDPEAEFATYRTFDLYAGPRRVDGLTAKRVRRAVVAALEAKGLRRVDRRPDLMVAIHLRTRLERHVDTVHWGYGYRWPWWRVHAVHRVVRHVPVGSVVVDLVDARTRELVWRGVATDVLGRDPRANAEKIERAVRELLAGYPPATSTSPS